MKLASTVLRQMLETTLHQPICELRRSPSPYSTSSQLEDVRVLLSDGAQLDLVLKHVCSRGVKPEFVWNPIREIRAYQHILRERGDTAAYFASGDDWLLLEKVPGVELYQIGELDVWQAVARWLAAFHHWGKHVSDARLVQHTPDFYRRWMRRALTHLPDSTQLQWLAHRHDRVIDLLLAVPRTFVHGEFYPSNVLVDTRGPLRICPVDWEMAGHGPGLLDLAALTAGSWTTCQRDMIASSYRAAMAPPEMSDSDFSVALDACRFQMAIQWLGWSAGWRPPREHATDWLDEAVVAAERLEA